MYRYQPMYPFDQQFFGVMPVYAFDMGPVYHVGANRNLMCAFMPQPFWSAGPSYRNRLQHRQRPALMQQEYNKQKQVKQEQQREQEFKKSDKLKQKQEKREQQREQELMKTDELKQKQVRREQQQEQEFKKSDELMKNQERQKQEQEFKKSEVEEKPKNEPKQEVKVDETSAWQIPRMDGKQPQKKLLQTLILEEEVIDSLQNRHLEEELRAKHVLQKIHLEEELKAKRELKMRQLEEQFSVMHSLQKQQLEEELREKRLLQERQLEDELKAKESLQRRHLEEELRVKELLLNRKRISRKQHESNMETSKPRQQNDLQEKPKKNPLRQELEKLRQQPGHVDLKRKQLKKLLTQEICQLKQEILFEKVGKANNNEGQKHETDSVVLDVSLYPHTKPSGMSETEFAKHSCGHNHAVESDTLEGCVEIHEYLSNLSGLTAKDRCSTNSTSTSQIEKTDTRKSLIIDNEFDRISSTHNSNCKSPPMDSKSSSFSILSNDQNYTQFDELDQISPIGNADSSNCNSSPMETESHFSSFSVISESNDDNIACLMINDRDQNYTKFDEFGSISPMKHCDPMQMKSESNCSSFSVISEINDKSVDHLLIDDKDQSDIQCHDYGRVSTIEKSICKSPGTGSKLRSSSVRTNDKDESDTRCYDDFGGISPIENCKSPATESKSSFFSVMTIDKAHVDEFGKISVTDNSESTNTKSSTIESKSCQKSFSALPDKIDHNIDGLPLSVKDQNHMQFDESFRKDCIRCGRPFYVNDLGEYLKSETCTYHWGTLHYVYKGKHGYSAQYTCCKGHKDSEGCIRSALHIWSGVVYSP